MHNTSGNVTLPVQIRQLTTFVITVSAALLYGGVLGAAIVRTLAEPSPLFTEGMARTASLLGGLVGSVVAAGFAQGNRPLPGMVRATRPWARLMSVPLTVVSYGPAKLVALARLLGLPVGPSAPSRAEPGGSAPQPGVPEGADLLTSAGVWVALLYFAVYFLVGISAFVLFLAKSHVPPLIADSAWVWVGTVSSSAYAYFGVGARS